MQDLILALAVLISGPIGPGDDDVPPPPRAYDDAPPTKAEGWPMEVKLDRARRKAARSAARQRNMVMLGVMGAQLNAQANVLAARSAAERSAFNYRMMNLQRVPSVSYSGPQSSWYAPSAGPLFDCTPSRPASYTFDCTPSRPMSWPPDYAGRPYESRRY